MFTARYELYLLTYSMVQSLSWEANWFAASQEIPRISRNPKVHYRNDNRPPPFSILVQPNQVHIPTSHLLEIHPNIIHPSTPRSLQWSLSLRFPHQAPIGAVIVNNIVYELPVNFYISQVRIIESVLGEGYVNQGTNGFILWVRFTFNCLHYFTLVIHFQRYYKHALVSKITDRLLSRPVRQIATVSALNETVWPWGKWSNRFDWQ